MNTFTKVLAGAAAGYAFRAYLKKDIKETSKIYTPPKYSGPILSDAFFDYVVAKISHFLYEDESNGVPRTYNRSYDGGSRYTRFGRRSRN
jgi:hypothetical protein